MIEMLIKSRHKPGIVFNTSVLWLIAGSLHLGVADAGAAGVPRLGVLLPVDVPDGGSDAGHPVLHVYQCFSRQIISTL